MKTLYSLFRYSLFLFLLLIGFAGQAQYRITGNDASPPGRFEDAGGSPVDLFPFCMEQNKLWCSNIKHLYTSYSHTLSGTDKCKAAYILTLYQFSKSGTGNPLFKDATNGWFGTAISDTEWQDAVWRITNPPYTGGTDPIIGKLVTMATNYCTGTPNTTMGTPVKLPADEQVLNTYNGCAYRVPVTTNEALIIIKIPAGIEVIRSTSGVQNFQIDATTWGFWNPNGLTNFDMKFRIIGGFGNSWATLSGPETFQIDLMKFDSIDADFWKDQDATDSDAPNCQVLGTARYTQSVRSSVTLNACVLDHQGYTIKTNCLNGSANSYIIKTHFKMNIGGAIRIHYYYSTDPNQTLTTPPFESSGQETQLISNQNGTVQDIYFDIPVSGTPGQTIYIYYQVIDANSGTGSYFHAWKRFSLTLPPAGSSGCGSCTGTAPTLTLSNSLAISCPGSTAILSGVLSSGTISSIAWAGPSGFTSTALQPSIVLPQSLAVLRYSATATSTATSTNTAVQCLYSSSNTIAITPTCTGCAQRSLTVTATSACLGGNITLSATMASPGSRTGPYLWSGPNAFTSTLTSATLSSVTLAMNGVYTTTSRVSGLTCQTTASGQVTVNIQDPVADIIHTQPCVGGTLLLGVVGTKRNYAYTWSGPNSFSSNLVSPSIPTVTVAASGIYSVTLTSTSAVPTCENTLTGTVSITIAACATGADISLKKTISNSSPNTGDTVTYSVIITNHGPQTANNVKLKDVLPAGVTFVSVSTGVGTYDTGTGIWEIGTVPVGQRTVTMTVTVN